MKKVKFLTAILFILALLLTVAIPLISSTMQDFYKAQWDESLDNGQVELVYAKKNQWSKIGETSSVFAYASLGLACVFVVEHIIDRKQKQN